MSGLRRKNTKRDSAGFTIVEIMVVIGVIIVLAGILLPALVSVRKTGHMTESMSNLKQIATWMRIYSTDNRDQILPSQFNYEDNPNPGKVRSTAVSIGDEHKGTWSDILWAENEIGVFPVDGDPTAPDYRFDSPDRALYELQDVINVDILRSAAKATRRTPMSRPTDLPKPFGAGGDNTGMPGYFAANNFFNSDATSTTFNGWFTNGQMKLPDRSVYLVDSVAGEIIEDEEKPWDNSITDPSILTLEVDYRYPGDTCLMLFLDGHIDPQGEWQDLCDLEMNRNVRVRDLTKRNPPCDTFVPQPNPAP